MSWYQRWIVPRLIDLAMRNHRLDAYRQRTIGAATGSVLEIGVGSGQNLPLYGSSVDRVYAIDPALELLRLAKNKIAVALIPVSPIYGRSW
jgi:protein-L-isoaspartate O-methyltransferase